MNGKRKRGTSESHSSSYSWEGNDSKPMLLVTSWCMCCISGCVVAFGSSSQINIPLSLLGGHVLYSFSFYVRRGLHQLSVSFTVLGILCSYWKPGNGDSWGSSKSVRFLLVASGWFQVFLVFLTWLKGQSALQDRRGPCRQPRVWREVTRRKKKRKPSHFFFAVAESMQEVVTLARQNL